jgi:hypothetical protein
MTSGPRSISSPHCEELHSYGPCIVRVIFDQAEAILVCPSFGGCSRVFARKRGTTLGEQNLWIVLRNDGDKNVTSPAACQLTFQ